MASGSSSRLFSLEKVVTELDITGLVVDEDGSDDEFQGYIGELEYQQEGEETAEHESECNGDKHELCGECE